MKVNSKQKTVVNNILITIFLNTFFSIGTTLSETALLLCACSGDRNQKRCQH